MSEPASEPSDTAGADPRRAIPRTDLLLAEPEFAAAARALGRATVKTAITGAQHSARVGTIGPGEVRAAALAALPARPGSARPVLNATGVLVHTNLGRAPLGPAAVTALTTAAGTTDVEFDLATGARGPRGTGTVEALRAAVDAPCAAHVVNNNAAALLLCALALTTADRREIVIARGELVEIGDGFRIPDLLASTGARLHEVGTTNRVTRADYAAAVGEHTAFVLKVHPSNFLVTGFTAAVPVAELAELPVPVVVDVGSGLLRPEPLLPDEPDATTALRDGADLVTASGDKLLGGPQAGLLLGDPDLVHRLRRHPAARALRTDKLTLAALEATLRGPEPPVRAALHAPVADLRARAETLAARLRADGIDATATESTATVGGGGAPGVELPSAAVSLPAAYATALRTGDPAVVGRTERGRCLLDLRAVHPCTGDTGDTGGTGDTGDTDDTLAAAVRAAAERACG